MVDVPSPDQNRKRRRSERRARRTQERADRSLKETLESVVVAFILAFTFRVYVLEAYIIPTGSMAPTLLGGHVEAICEQCGYAVVSDAAALRDRPAETLRCPMCFFQTPLEAAPGLLPAVRAGDRILVQKYAGVLAEPKRFDVVVFKNPQNPFGSGQNFIKRLTGLPGERLMLLDGNVYVAKEPDVSGEGPDEASASLLHVQRERLRWRIARKTDEDANPRAEGVQRAVFRPVYHSRWEPADGGEPAGGEKRWERPWRPAVGAWNMEKNRYTPAADDGDGENAWALHFDFSPVRGRPGYQRASVVYPYNQLDHGPGELAVFEDFRIAVTLGEASAAPTPAPVDGAPAGPAGVSPDRLGAKDPPEVTLAGVTRLAGGPVHVRARFGPGGAWIETRPADPQEPWVRLAASADGVTLPPARAAPRLEFWVVDQELSAWIDGERVVRHRVDLGFEELLSRPAPPSPNDQDLRVELRSASPGRGSLVDRDLFHDAGGPRQFHGGAYRALSGGIRRERVQPIRLAADQYFLLGDNSPQSDDGRRWSGVDPWIRERYFPGVPLSAAVGRVPRALLIGRAFYVYYPAARPLLPGGAAVVPDLGRMRAIH